MRKTKPYAIASSRAFTEFLRAKVRSWPSTPFRCGAAIFPESEVDRTRRGHRESGAHDPNRTKLGSKARISSGAPEINLRKHDFLNKSGHICDTGGQALYAVGHKTSLTVQCPPSAPALSRLWSERLRADRLQRPRGERVTAVRAARWACNAFACMKRSNR
jgi:hypothetical protein